MKKIRKKRVKVLFTVLTGILLGSMSVQTTVQTTKASEVTSTKEYKEKDAFTGETLKVKEVVEEYRKNVFKYRLDGTLKYEDSYISGGGPYYLYRAKIWVNPNEVHEYQYEEDYGKQPRITVSKDVTLYDNQKNVIKRESFIGEEDKIKYRITYLSTDRRNYEEIKYDTSYPSYTISSVVNVIDGYEKKRVVYQNYEDDKTGKIISSIKESLTDDGKERIEISNRFGNNQNIEREYKEIKRYAPNGYSFNYREVSETEYNQKSEPVKREVTKYSEEDEKLQFKKYKDYYVFEAGKNIKVKTEVNNKKTGYNDSTYLSDVWTYYPDGKDKQHLYYNESGYMYKQDDYSVTGVKTTEQLDGVTKTSDNNVLEKDAAGRLTKQTLYAQKYGKKEMVEERFFNPETGLLKEVKKYEGDSVPRYDDIYDENGVKTKTILQQRGGMYAKIYKTEMDYNNRGYMTKKVLSYVNVDYWTSGGNYHVDRSQEITIFDDNENLVSFDKERLVDDVVKEKSGMKYKDAKHLFEYAYSGEGVFKSENEKEVFIDGNVRKTIYEKRGSYDYQNKTNYKVYEYRMSEDGKKTEHKHFINNVIQKITRYENGYLIEDLNYENGVVIN